MSSSTFSTPIPTCNTSAKITSPLQQLNASVQIVSIPLISSLASPHLDQTDPIPSLRSQFHIPTIPTTTTSSSSSSSIIYLCGNSLGLQPLSTNALIQQELDVWAQRGVLGHFNHPYKRPWVSIDETVTSDLLPIVGAQSINEIAVMGSLTNNLHILMLSYYRPTTNRYKILMESNAFPSDIYAITSQVNYHGYNPNDTIITLTPRDGEYTLRTDDIISVLNQQGNTIALCLLSGIQYYTGQYFNIPYITNIAHQFGCIVGWDLAHAIGNVPLYLHDWDVDFAVWCSYKYLNSGPGGIAGIFVHNKFINNPIYSPKLVGWWGHDKLTRFNMSSVFNPIPGAQGFQLSNPSVLTTIALYASLQIFSKLSMEQLRERSLRLTTYLEYLIDQLIIPLGPQLTFDLRIITPRDPYQRGAQLSLLFTNISTITPLMELLEQRGIIVDERKPNVIRVAPTPLYNTFTDVRKFVDILIECLHILGNKSTIT